MDTVPPTNNGHADATKGLTERLREAREVLGLTQEDVARALGIPRTSVHALETGKRKVSVDEISKLARLYQRGVAWLVGEEPTPDVSGSALYRATADLSESDRDQVVRFAEFLASAPKPKK